MLVRWLVRRYPVAWRERYGEEISAIFDDRRLRFTDVIDLLIGALDAHLDPHGIDSLHGKVLSTMNRLRSSEIQLFCAYIVFVIAGMSFQKVTEYEDFAAAANAHQVIGVAYALIVFGAGMGLLAVLAGGLPIAWATLRFALANRRRDIFLRFAVPPISFLVWLGYTIFLSNYGPTGNVDSLPKVAVASSWLALFLVAAFASTSAVSTAVTRAEIDTQLFRFALVPGALTVVTMALVAVSVVVWAIGIQVSDPALLTGNGGVMSTNTLVSLGGQIVVMIGATIFAALAFWRGRVNVADTAVA